MKKKKDGVSALETTTYSFGALGREISSSCVNVFFLVYLNIYMGLDVMVLTVAFVFAKLWDAINDPLLATLVNNTKKSRFGRFRPWMAIGAILNCASLILMFTPFGFNSEIAKYTYYIGMYVIWGMTFTVMDVPFWSMLPTIANSTDDRNKVSSFAKLIGGFGGFTISSIGTALIIPKLAATKGALTANFVLAIVAAVITFCFMYVTILCNKEKYVLPETKSSVGNIFRLFKTNDQLAAYSLSYIMFIVATTIATFQIIYVFIYYGDMGGLGYLSQGLGYTVFTAVSCTGQGIAMIFYTWIVRKIPREKIFGSTYFMGSVGMIGLFCVFFFLKPEYASMPNSTAKWVNVIVLALAGAFMMTASGLNQIGSTVMIADVVDYGEWKNGERCDSVIFSIQTLLYKFSGAIAMLIIGIGIKVAKLPSITQQFDETTKSYVYTFINETGTTITTSALDILRVFMFLVPIPVCLLGYVAYKKKYFLFGEKYDKIKKEIDERREEKVK